MNNLTKKIYDIKRSKSYIDYNKYHVGNIFGITKVSRWELMHSNFISWALSPSSSHSLIFYPLTQLIRSLEFLIDKYDNKNSRLDLDVIRKFYNPNFIVNATVEREVEHIDIVIMVETKEKILPILIENKVDSKENGKEKDQTKVYFSWGENKFSDRNKYFEPVYLFLLPEYNSKVVQKEEKYIRMTYQELVDYVLEPSMHKCGDIDSINNYKIYLQCLSFQADSEKGENTMAISSEEREILDSFIKENKNLLCSLLNELKDEVDEDVLSSVTASVKDYSTYSFEGKTYTKSRLVLAVVNKYISDNPSTDYQQLLNAFPQKLQGSKGVVCLEDKVSLKDKGIGGNKRFFVDEPISLKDGGKVLVCTQWGIGNISGFIDHVNNKFGYSIIKT